MSKLLNIFMLSGAVLGLFLNFTPEYFSRVAVPAKPAPGSIESVSNVVKVVNVLINEQSFAVSLESLDKKYILDIARKFCSEKAELLKIGGDELENGCVRPVSSFLFKEVYETDKIKEFPVTVVLPVEGHGSFNIKFDIIKVTPNQAARSFCLDKQTLFQIADDALETSCVRGVDEFIVRDLQKQEILKKDDVVEETQQQTEATPEPVAQQEQQRVETTPEQIQEEEVSQAGQTQQEVTSEPSQVETQLKVEERAPPVVPRDINELPIPPHEEHPQEVRVETAVESDVQPAEAVEDVV